MHDLPGGVCTSWKRGGYTVDGCIGWLVGSSPDSAYYKVYQELGAVQGREFVNYDEFLRVHDDESGQDLILYTDPDKLEAHLKEISLMMQDHRSVHQSDPYLFAFQPIGG
jgi:phytoene dehydrogenase-like protein